MPTTGEQRTIAVDTAAAIIVFMSAIGGAFGYLFIVRLVESFASELEAREVVQDSHVLCTLQ